ncbi:hypothetical protein GWI33_013797 [Rhynchophorus ferrugineus]|uniref:Uncharacterized protein n=1 Tax=Rhynchophorus ferrugineus TaxID=354439 RepID=A0A834I2R5_RHYFE|nr:hypothetical protein GWI33_013797 [Rhynchophorus ferrugineus]
MRLTSSRGRDSLHAADKRRPSAFLLPAAGACFTAPIIISSAAVYSLPVPPIQEQAVGGDIMEISTEPGVGNSIRIFSPSQISRSRNSWLLSTHPNVNLMTSGSVRYPPKHGILFTKYFSL